VELVALRADGSLPEGLHDLVDEQQMEDIQASQSLSYLRRLQLLCRMRNLPILS